MKSISGYISNLGSKLHDLPLLLMRVILAYSFFNPGLMKWKNIEGTAYWYESLGIPLPKFNVILSASTEMAGVFLLLLGLGTRVISIPLIIVLLVAMITVHIGNGWLAIADSSAPGIADRLSKAKDLLKEHGNYEWLTEQGGFVILQNGIEFPAMYIVMLLALLAFGPGKVSVDNLIHRYYQRKKSS